MTCDEAIVLVGGLGTRLRSVVSDVPKPLAPVAGRPFLAWVLDRLVEARIRRVVLATGYMSSLVERTIGDCWLGMAIDYSIEMEPLGTGGAIRAAKARLRGQDVHVLNGDTYLKYQPARLQSLAEHRDAAIGMALARVEDATRYGKVALEEGRVKGFREKGQAGPGHVNAGCYYLSHHALDSLPETRSFSFESEVLAPAVARGDVIGYLETDEFIDIGVPEDYRRAQTVFAKGPP